MRVRKAIESYFARSWSQGLSYWNKAHFLCRRVHLCKIDPARVAPLVSHILKLAVPAGVFGMTQSVVLPVMRISTAPCLLAVPPVLFVVGVTGKFLPLPQPLSCALADLVAAVSLVLHAWIGGEQATAVRTTDLMLHGFLTSKAIKNDYDHCGKEKPGSKRSKRVEVSGSCEEDKTGKENAWPSADRHSGRLSHRPFRPPLSPPVTP